MTEQREGSEYFMSGANAMALGMCFMDNPYYKQDAMPRRYRRKRRAVE